MKSSSSQQQAPRTYLENQDIRCVTSPYPTSTSKTSSPAEGIITPVLSAEMKDVVLERLKKEIMSKIGGGSMCRSSGGGSMVNLSGKKRRRERTSKTTTSIQSSKDGVPMMGTAESVVRSRFIVGINQCTRALENAINETKYNEKAQGSKQNIPMPALILLSRDVRPATILAHIPLYAKLLNVHTLILPGKASAELGKIVGIKSVAAAVFLSSSGEDSMKGNNKQEWKEAQNDVDSFVKYVISKIPK